MWDVEPEILISISADCSLSWGEVSTPMSLLREGVTVG
jgi:hypothetical protein